MSNMAGRSDPIKTDIEESPGIGLERDYIQAHRNQKSQRYRSLREKLD